MTKTTNNSNDNGIKPKGDTRRQMAYRLAISLLLTLLLLLFHSVLYKTIILMGLFGLWRNKLASRIAPNRRPWFKRAIWCVLVISLWMAMPRWRTGCTDRVRLFYLGDSGNVKHPPLSQYFANVIVPENELMNFGLIGVRLSLFDNGTSGLSSGLINQARKIIDDGNAGNFFKPYFMGTSNPMSGIWAQVFNEAFGENNRAMYLCKPMAYTSNCEYPLIVFCHGYLGNWRLYQGILKGFNDAIVISIPTHGLDGIFTTANINEIFTIYIPSLEKLGFNIDHRQIHLIGLSNGVSAINSALNSAHCSDFSSLTAISGNIQRVCKVPCKINLVGGGKDLACKKMPFICTKLKSIGVDAEMLFNKKENHFMLINETDDIIKFLTSRMLLRVNNEPDPE